MYVYGQVCASSPASRECGQDIPRKTPEDKNELINVKTKIIFGQRKTDHPQHTRYEYNNNSRSVNTVRKGIMCVWPEDDHPEEEVGVAVCFRSRVHVVGGLLVHNIYLD